MGRLEIKKIDINEGEVICWRPNDEAWPNLVSLVREGADVKWYRAIESFESLAVARFEMRMMPGEDLRNGEIELGYSEGMYDVWECTVSDRVTKINSQGVTIWYKKVGGRSNV